MKPPTYSARVLGKIPNPPGPRGEPTWNSIEVGVFRTIDEQETQVGRYVRSYTTLFKTFLHFRRAGQDFALYSPSYTGTRLLRLPECVDIGGEEPNPNGFCLSNTTFLVKMMGTSILKQVSTLNAALLQDAFGVTIPHGRFNIWTCRKLRTEL